MQVSLIYIEKKDEEFKKLSQKYMALISNFARIKEINLNNNKISKAAKLGKNEALKAYEEAFKPYQKGYCVILDEEGKNLSSIEFAKLLEHKSKLSFFISGAYGLDKEFIKSFDFALIDTSSQIDIKISENLKSELGEIKHSLEKIKDKTYGICELCSEDIDIARLKIKPFARYCIMCRQIVEERQKNQ